MLSREQILVSLRGKQVAIPNLFTTFHGWIQVEINAHYQKLVVASDERLESIFDDERRLKALKATDFAFFVATWWPKTEYEELKVLLYFVIWLFTWDDEIDEPTGCYTDDLASADGYRKRTTDFVLECLGLQGKRTAKQFNATDNKMIASFKSVGESLADALTLDQRKRFMAEVTRFIDKSKAEQKFRLDHIVPTVGEYSRFRMGTSAVGLVTAILEYAMKVQMCDQVMNKDPQIKAIADETNIIISIVNDLLSLKKEVAKGCVDNVVPLLCAQGMSAQEAVDEAIVTLEASKSKFDTAAGDLLACAQRDPGKYRHVSEWIEGCQSFCIGNLAWSLATGRYGVGEYCDPEDGSVRFTL